MGGKRQRSVSLTGRQREHLELESKRLGISESEVVRRVLDAWLDGAPLPPRPRNDDATARVD